VDKPVLKTPEIEQYNIPITGKLYWDAVPGVISYKAQLSLDNTFEYPILDLDGLTKTEMEYGILNYNKEYYWRVMANGEKAKSDWSETGTFYTKLETPNLFEPEDNSDKVKINTHFSWTPIDGATEYIVQFSKETGFSQNIEQTENYNLLTNIDMLAGFTRYYWRVMGTGGKKESDWSYVWSFTTAKLNGIEDNVSVACEVKSYPNPFTDFMIISFQTNLVSDISISIFSLDDKCQQSIVQQKLNIGFFSIYLNTAGWNDGIYFIKIKVNNEIKINMAIKCGK